MSDPCQIVAGWSVHRPGGIASVTGDKYLLVKRGAGTGNHNLFALCVRSEKERLQKRTIFPGQAVNLNAFQAQSFGNARPVILFARTRLVVRDDFAESR